jgi:hypothetical protein
VHYVESVVLFVIKYKSEMYYSPLETDADLIYKKDEILLVI